MLLNAQGITPQATSSQRWKLPFLVDKLEEQRSDFIPFIGITETWLKSYITDSQIAIENYSSLRSDRHRIQRGRVLMYVHNSLPVSEVVTYDKGKCEAVMGTLSSINTILVTLYRPPGTSDEMFRELLLAVQQYLDNAMDRKHHDIYIMGDFNLPSIDWKTLADDHSQGQVRGIVPAQRLFDFMGTNFLTQIVDVPTREENTLDLVLTNCPQYIHEVQSEKLPISDHNLVSVTTGFDWRTPTSDRTGGVFPDPDSFGALNCYEGDYQKMGSLLDEVNWERLRDCCIDSGDDDGSMFMELIRLTCLQLALLTCPRKRIPDRPCNGAQPTKKKKTNKKKEILRRKKRKLKARIRALEALDPTAPNIKTLSDNVNLLNIEMRDAINEEFNRREMQAVATVKKNPRFFFSYAKRYSKLRSNVGPLRNEDESLTTDPKAMADILQTQYLSAFTDPSNPHIKDTTAALPEADCKLEDLKFDEEDIIKAIDEINTYSSTSHGCIPACILKACKEKLSHPLMMLWEQSFAKGKIPSSLKDQFITPIFKKGSKSDPANYRPVSLTSHVIKIFERIIRNTMVSYLEDNYLLSNKQHGFRKGRSCLTQLLSHYDAILRNLNSEDETDVIYLDFSKAFDKVDHGLLLKKLKHYGIGGKLLDWIREFLVNRKQIVTVDGIHSEPADVLSGVPQGTVLGPLLFLLYINDLEKVVSTSAVASFADDTRLSASIREEGDTKLLQEDMNRVVTWSVDNNMVLHEGKFEFLCYRTGSSKWLEEMPFTSPYLEYTTPAGFTLSPQSSVRDLGVTLSSDYQWRTHINLIAAGARQLASWALGVFRDRSAAVMLTIWKSLIRCKLEYCCPLWHPHRLEDVKTLENVQRFFTRHIAGMEGADYWERLSRLKLQSLQRRRERYIIIHMWKLLHNLVPNDLNVEFYHRERLGWRARIPVLFKRSRQSSKTIFDASFAVNGPKLWNILPKSVNSAVTLDSLKVHLGAFLESVPDCPPTSGYTAANANSMLNWCNDNQQGGLRQKL